MHTQIFEFSIFDAAQADLHRPVCANQLLPRIPPSRPIAIISTHLTPRLDHPTGCECFIAGYRNLLAVGRSSPLCDSDGLALRNKESALPASLCVSSSSLHHFRTSALFVKIKAQVHHFTTTTTSTTTTTNLYVFHYHPAPLNLVDTLHRLTNSSSP